MTRPLVIGVGQGGVDSLPADLRDRLADMDLIIAAPRFHASLPDGPEILDWPRPFSNIYNIINDYSKKSLALLTTGDPMWFGAGASLVRTLGPDACEVVPAVSGSACVGVRMADVRMPRCQHSWPAGGSLAAALHPRARLLVIAQDGGSPREVARLLVARGYGAASMHVLADLGERARRALMASHPAGRVTLFPISISSAFPARTPALSIWDWLRLTAASKMMAS